MKSNGSEKKLYLTADAHMDLIKQWVMAERAAEGTVLPERK